MSRIAIETFQGKSINLNIIKKMVGEVLIKLEVIK